VITTRSLDLPYFGKNRKVLPPRLPDFLWNYLTFSSLVFLTNNRCRFPQQKLNFIVRLSPFRKTLKKTHYNSWSLEKNTSYTWTFTSIHYRLNVRYCLPVVWKSSLHGNYAWKFAKRYLPVFKRGGECSYSGACAFLIVSTL
jgi:hypothetical protein